MLCLVALLVDTHPRGENLVRHWDFFMKLKNPFTVIRIEQMFFG